MAKKSTNDPANSDAANVPQDEVVVPPAAEQASLDAILNEVVRDTVEPSAVADMAKEPVMGEPSSGRLDGSPMPGSAEFPASQAEKRGRGRPRKTEQSIPRPKLSGIDKGAIPPVDEGSAGIEPAAQLCVLMINNTGMMLGGELAAMRENEAVMAKGGFVAYFKAKGIQNVPPWIILAGALSPYYLRIMTTTPAKSTVSTIAGRMWFGIKEFIKRRKNARSYNRNNVKRENDTSAETSTKSA